MGRETRIMGRDCSVHPLRSGRSSQPPLKVIIPAIVSVLLAGCGLSHVATESAPTGASVAVRSLTLAPSEWPNTWEAAGTVRARTATVVSSKVMGYVREVRVHLGDRVRQGQTLVTLDARDLEASYRQAGAARDEAASAMPEIENGIASAKAGLELAQATHERMRDLYEKRSISNQEFDESTAKLKMAQAGYEISLSRRRQLESKIAQAEQGMTAAAVVRDYAQITAPFAGTVTEKTVEPGTLATPGAPLLTLEREGGYRLEVPVEESRLGLVRSGQTAKVILESGEIEGRVSEIAPSVDSAARSFMAKIDLPASPRVRSGLFGRAIFASGKRSLLAVPTVAVTTRGQLNSVLVADGKSARSRLVTLGQRSGDAVEVLSGLNAGDELISPVPAGLEDGGAIQVRP